MENTTLGMYQMVISLSQKNINSLFEDLKDEGTIHDVWSIRMQLDGRQQLISDSVVINEGFGTDEDPSYDEVKEKFDEAFDNAKNKENMLGFIADINYPSISIIENNYFNVHFNIPFKKGVMKRTYMGFDSIDQWSLDGILYVFTVEVDKISIPYTKAKYVNSTAKKNVDDYVKNQSEVNNVKAEDFTIENLFLNFENADFIADSAYTIDPNDSLDLSQWNDLQKLIQLYFKGILAKSENPYVLGYGVTIPDLEDRAPAIFQPRSLNLSTSFVPILDTKDKNGKNLVDSSKSSLNYLMMVNRKPSTSSTAGVMTSLIEKNSMLGIDGDLFYDLYLKESIIKDIIDALNESINNADKSASSTTDSPIGFPEIGNSGSSSSIDHTGEFEVKDYKNFNSLVKDGIELGEVTVNAYYGHSSGSRDNITMKTFSEDIHLCPNINLAISEEEIDGTIESVLKVTVNLKMSVNYQKTYKMGIWPEDIDKAATSNFSSGGSYQSIEFKLYPGDKGEMVTKSELIGTEKMSKTSGEESTISDVEAKIEGGDFYSSLQSEKLLNTVMNSVQKQMDTLPQIVLPVSNVYLYKSIGFAGSEDNINTVKIQSTYSASYNTQKTQKEITNV